MVNAGHVPFLGFRDTLCALLQFTQIKNMDEQTNEKKITGIGNNALIPLAIVGASIIIAGAIILSNGFSWGGNTLPEDSARVPELKPVTARDHRVGSPDAEIVIVEFSDLECPFCKTFQETMKRVIQEYGDAGSVAWVYRHFPLDSIHTKARKEAEATECAAELGGQLAFWEFTDKIFSVTPSNDNLDLAILPDLAEDIGLNRTAFEECLASGKYAARVADDLADAVAAGARGTPYSVILTKDGKTIPVSGAESFDTMKSLIERELKK